jgi:uncharacterized coiled-coil DUF342 family protein
MRPLFVLFVAALSGLTIAESVLLSQFRNGIRVRGFRAPIPNDEGASHRDRANALEKALAEQRIEMSEKAEAMKEDAAFDAKQARFKDARQHRHILTAERNKLNDQIMDLQSEMSKIKAKGAQTDDLSLRLDEQASSIAKLKTGLDEINSKVSELSTMKKMMNDDIERETTGETAKALAKDDSKIKVLVEENDSLRLEADSLREKVENLQAQNGALKTSMESAERKMLAKVKRKFDRRAGSVKKELDELNLKIASMKKEKNRVEDERDQMKDMVGALQNQTQWLVGQMYEQHLGHAEMLTALSVEADKDEKASEGDDEEANAGAKVASSSEEPTEATEEDVQSAEDDVEGEEVGEDISQASDEAVDEKADDEDEAAGAGSETVGSFIDLAERTPPEASQDHMASLDDPIL